jgi:hypothetical protein
VSGRHISIEDFLLTKEAIEKSGQGVVESPTLKIISSESGLLDSEGNKTEGIITKEEKEAHDEIRILVKDFYRKCAELASRMNRKGVLIDSLMIKYNGDGTLNLEFYTRIKGGRKKK